MTFKVILERKGTGEKKIYSTGNYFNAKEIYKNLQETKNKDNDYLVHIEESEFT